MECFISGNGNIYCSLVHVHGSQNYSLNPHISLRPEGLQGSMSFRSNFRL